MIYTTLLAPGHIPNIRIAIPTQYICGSGPCVRGLARMQFLKNIYQIPIIYPLIYNYTRFFVGVSQVI